STSLHTADGELKDAGNWFKKRRLNKQTALFWQRLQQGDAATALELYERELAPDQTELSKELRAAYHLNRWLARRDAADVEALRLLPAPQSLPDEACKKIRAHLLIWAASTLGRYDLIAKEPALLDALPVERRDELQLAIAFGQAQAALRAHQIDEARRALDIIARLSGAEAHWQLTLAAGRLALEHDAGETAAAWFTELLAQAQTDASPQWRLSLTLALALAQLQAGQYAAARETLAQLNRQLAADYAAGAGAQIDPNLRAALGAQSHYLTALSLLAGTRDWATPARADDATAPEHDREIGVQNRALWNDLRAQL